MCGSPGPIPFSAHAQLAHPRGRAPQEACLPKCVTWRTHIAGGHPWTEALDFKFKYCGRAVRRGLGPRKQAQPFDLTAIAALSGGTVAEFAKPNFQLFIREVIIVAS